VGGRAGRFRALGLPGWLIEVEASALLPADG
jgi:hypothetical protein